MLEILFEDREILVVVKPADQVSEQTERHDGFADRIAEYLLSDYVGVVHRLDRGVGGVMVYAKTPSAAAALSRSITEGSFEKEYLAAVHGVPSPSEGDYTDLLFHDRRCNKTYVTDRPRGGVKEARLSYRCLESKEISGVPCSLMTIRLHTGRTHQIRVQFASRRHPLLGDRKYGAPAGFGGIHLFCRRISFPHPSTRQQLCFCKDPMEVRADFF